MKMHFPKAARSIGFAPLALTTTIAILYYRQRPSIVPRSITVPADGAEHDALRIRLPALPLGSNVTADTGIRLLQSKDPLSLEGVIRTPVTPSKANLHLQWRDHAMTIPGTYVLDPSDSYGDGTPDFLRLHTFSGPAGLSRLVRLHRRGSTGATSSAARNCGLVRARLDAGYGQQRRLKVTADEAGFGNFDSYPSKVVQ